MAQSGKDPAPAIAGGDYGEVHPLDVPLFYATSSNVTFPGTDASVMFFRPRPAVGSKVQEGQAIALMEPICSVQMSAQSLKDLVLALNIELERYEKEGDYILDKALG